MSKPKEFYVNQNGEVSLVKNEYYTLRVIEKSAYDEIADANIELNCEVDETRKTADKLAEALERVRRDLFESGLDTRNFVSRETIEQALKEYRNNK